MNDLTSESAIPESSSRFKNSLKFGLTFGVCMLIRFIPFRPANVEPLTASVMPISKKSSWIASFAFGFFSILIFDALTNFGLWTWITAICYGLVGLGSKWYFQKKAASAWNFFVYGILATLFYDILTGLLMGPVLFHQPFMLALLGQIPFTGRHLLGTIVLSITVSPLLYRWVSNNQKLELSILKAPVKVL
jgi:nitrate reductase NapE component